MNRPSLILTAFLLAGCSSPEPARRTHVPPPAAPQKNIERVLENEKAMPTNEEATQTFLEKEIERNRPPAPPPTPTQPTVQYQPPPQVYQQPYQAGGAASYDQPSPLPWNTAIGAGVGAIIGHQSGHRGEGAAIGAGIGFLLDLARWNW